MFVGHNAGNRRDFRSQGVEAFAAIKSDTAELDGGMFWRAARKTKAAPMIGAAFMI
ncbi:hypothetical protein [Brevundimonas sp. SORGH_AS_0993]|uniref:hypothetical protein n=1 Tax=Brevundimonas sp. SORGH_AS_0993 TaxID=3041794 RepID=UPI002782F52A|nr:hypothetical protein [Brevundimonas sp. SORGH_AS_0993]MDQ1154214.1 hypothetical protein [Brevundimonas sp. SORGH_AS_0993]